MTQHTHHTIQAAFESALPRIQRHGQVCFRNEKCPGKKAEYLAEMTAICWKWWLRLSQKGCNPLLFVAALASFSARAVRSGRRLCGQEKARDVLSPVAQRRHGFCVSKLPDYSTFCVNPLIEALHDNTQTPPDEQAAFRCDFPAFLSTLSAHHQELVGCLMKGERTSEVARRFRRSSARISQLRREYHAAWLHFHGEITDTASRSASSAPN